MGEQEPDTWQTMFVPRSGWPAEPSLPSETNKSNPLLHNSSDVGFQKPQRDKILERGETVKEEQWKVELRCFMKTDGEPQEYAYHRSGEEHLPRYMPLGDHLEGHILFQEEDSSLTEPNYAFTSSDSYRSAQYSPLPPSPGMLSPGKCWPGAEQSSEAPIASEVRITPLHTASDMHLVSPPTPPESRRSAYGNETPHNATGNLSREAMKSHSVESVARMATGFKKLNAKEAEEKGKERKHNQTSSELQLFPQPESSEPNSAADIESPQDSLMSDTESDSEGGWLTGRYIPDFLQEQWLNGSALEMPTMEARAMSIVRQALVDQVMSALPVFNPKWAADFTSNTGSGDNSSTSSITPKPNKHSASNSSSSNNDRKRSWDNEDDPPAGGNDGPPDPLRSNPRKPQDLHVGLKLACPFRKHNPEKYNLHDYRVCATKPWDSISRLKQHIRVTHKRPIYCPKCKEIFETSEALDSHLDVPAEEDYRACKHRDLPKPEGITPEMDEKLKGRWRASPPQALWGKIYEILFPNETVPSPDFDQVLDVSIPTGTFSPTPNFERPSRRDFLRFVRARVDSEVDVDIKSLPERTKSKLADIVEDCYVQFDLKYPNSQEARRDMSVTKAPRRLLDEALQNDTQQLNWGTMEEGGLQPIVESKVKGPQINVLTPPQLPWADAPLRAPSTDSNSNCPCIGQCVCSASTSSASMMPDMNFKDSVLYMSQYEALWDAGTTDMNLFDSFVNGDDRSFFCSEH